MSTNKRLLVVEDYPDTARILCQFLGELGAVDSAATVNEALEKAKATPYNLLVVDIQLGEQRTGVDVMKTLRTYPYYERIPMVACTAYARLGDPERLIEAGFDGFIAKPFTKDLLLREIKRHWQSRRHAENTLPV